MLATALVILSCMAHAAPCVALIWVCRDTATCTDTSSEGGSFQGFWHAAARACRAAGAGDVCALFWLVCASIAMCLGCSRVGLISTRSSGPCIVCAGDADGSVGACMYHHIQHHTLRTICAMCHSLLFSHIAPCVEHASKLHPHLHVLSPHSVSEAKWGAVLPMVQATRGKRPAWWHACSMQPCAQVNAAASPADAHLQHAHST